MKKFKASLDKLCEVEQVSVGSYFIPAICPLGLCSPSCRQI